MDLAARRDATRRTVERFAGHPFAWGQYDCGKMVIAHLRLMGRRPVLGPGGSWKSAVGLARFLRRHGGSGAACLDEWMPHSRIIPAQAIIGDVVEMPGDSVGGTFGVCVGNGRVLAYHEDAEAAAIIQPGQYLAAWRV
ncbi:MAG: hypothetical protein CMN63_06805 [Sphingobium sp.]|nr:hypothetical protein [Sphingobium sp.]|tara:strand:+ start:1186 stop:1599 length:414 start_codon:yes stop_codon:yes gene_type:complete